MWRCALLVLVAGITWAADTVVLLDGSSRTGTVTWRDGDRLAIGGADGTAEVALADVDQIQLAGSAPSAGELGLWLVDGSWLPCTAVASRADDTILARTSLGELVIPLAAVRGWGPTLPTAGPADRLVVVSGTYDGRVRGIRDGHLVFVSEALGELTVDLADCLGLRLGGSDRVPDLLRVLAELHPAQLPVALLPGEQPRLVAAPTVTLSGWPTGVPLRIEGGRRVYLSDLTPILVEEEGAFGRVWPHRRDRNLEGGPILLDGQRHTKGVSVHSQARLRWQLQRRFVRFTTVIGIADEVGFEGDCPVIISGDGRELWRRDALTGRDPAERLALDVTGVDVLEIRVDFGNRYDIGDRVTLGGAALIGE